MVRSDLPFGSEFSPDQIDLAIVLEIAYAHGEDWHSFEAEVRQHYFSDYHTSDYNKGKLANNTKLSMRSYGLVQENDASLTEVGQSLYTLRDRPSELHTAFARHILMYHQGMNFVQCILDMQAAGETVSLNSLRQWLVERGIQVPRGGKHMSTLRLWLERAGVFASGYRVNHTRLKEILGVDAEEFESLAQLSEEQRAFVKTLANIDHPGPYPSNDIEKLASATYGVKFNEKSLPKQVLYPLERAGYVELTRGTREPGRGAKPFLIKTTAKFATELLIPLIEQIEQQVQSDLRPLLRKSIRDVRAEIESKDRHIAGLALEALAFKLMRLIDLTYITTRLRGVATGGAEVDLVFDGTRLVFSRWQVQCKNTLRVSLDDVAKEVGLTHFLKSNVIVVVTTGLIGEEARRYANKIMADSNLCIVMIDSGDLTEIERRPAAIIDVLTREARGAMQLKQISL